jgi:hypothetical protein
MCWSKFARLAALFVLTGVLSLVASEASAVLAPSDIFRGHVGLSVDAVGSNNSPVGQIQAQIPAGATVLKAYLYAAGTPYPWYPNAGAPASPQTVADYNGAGITLDGTPVTNFSKIVGAVSDRPAIGQWYTGRADVTSLVQSLATAGPSYNWTYTEGSALNNRIDGGVLVIAYEHASLPEGSVVILDGGQDTGGETTTVNFADPLGDVTDPAFFADMSLAISFSTAGTQVSSIDINGTRLASGAGGLDDGQYYDGGLITAGGVGDTNANPADPYSTSTPDDELYSLVPFLSEGDTSFTIFTENPTDDDNIFFMGLGISANVGSVGVIPEPTGFVVWSLLGAVALGFGWYRRRRAK